MNTELTMDLESASQNAVQELIQDEQWKSLQVRPEECFYYVRVSSTEQNINRQIDAVPSFIPRGNIYIDRQSGKDFDRAGYRQMCRRLRQGCCLFVKSVDRFGRSYEQNLEEWDALRKKGVQVYFLDNPALNSMDTENIIEKFLKDVLLLFYSMVSQQEREAIHKRQKEGIAAAQARGVVFGRPRSELPENFRAVTVRYLDGEISGVEAARQCGMKTATWRNRMKALCREDPEMNEKMERYLQKLADGTLRRPRAPKNMCLPENFREIVFAWTTDAITGASAARQCNVSYETFRRRAVDLCAEDYELLQHLHGKIRRLKEKRKACGREGETNWYDMLRF